MRDLVSHVQTRRVNGTARVFRIVDAVHSGRTGADMFRKPYQSSTNDNNRWTGPRPKATPGGKPAASGMYTALGFNDALLGEFAYYAFHTTLDDDVRRQLDGMPTQLTAATAWRRRFAARRLAGLKDDPRTGAPRTITDARVERAITPTLEQAPPDATHWSTRGLARAVGMSRTTVGRIWRAFGLQPHRSETFKLSTDLLCVEKVRDIVGLYLDPPARALVLCVDEKPSIQATEGTAPVMPMRPGQPERHTHDYVRHGTRDLFAALDVRAGTVIGEVHARRRSEEFRHFLDTVAVNTGPAPHPRQRGHAQDGAHPALGAEAAPRAPALHADERVLDQPGRVLVLAPAAPGPHARGLRQHRRARGGTARLHRRHERRAQALRLDQDRRRDPRVRQTLLPAHLDAGPVIGRRTEAATRQPG